MKWFNWLKEEPIWQYKEPCGLCGSSPTRLYEIWEPGMIPWESWFCDRCIKAQEIHRARKIEERNKTIRKESNKRITAHIKWRDKLLKDFERKRRNETN